MATSVIPQSRSEKILAATINGEEYNQPPQSRIEQLLIELKEAVEEGGGGGTTVIANPSGEATDELVKIKIGSTIYSIEGGTSVGGIALNKIWENPDPTATFSPSDVTIPSVANYEKFIMFYAQYKNGDGANMIASVIFMKGHGTDLMWVISGSDGVTARRRDISLTDDTTLHIGNCKTATGTTASSNRNEANIPLVLYAIDEHAAATGPSLDYNQLINLPKINQHNVSGDKTGSDYDLVDVTDGFTAAQKAALLALLD